MLRSAISFLLLIAIALAVSACGTRVKRIKEPQPLFDIRKSIVTADADVPPVVIQGVQARLDAAIASTVRPVELPQVVMSVHVNNITKGLGIQRGRSEANVSVVLSDVTDGHAFQTVAFPVYSFTLEKDAADEALVEAISGRIRYIYVLMTPQIRKPTYRQPVLSTRLKGEPLTQEPIVIPAAQAGKIGADADPVLNSKTVIKDNKPQAAIADDQPEANAVEDGASGKVLLNQAGSEKSGSALETRSDVPGQGSEEPCVETLETKCATAN